MSKAKFAPLAEFLEDPSCSGDASPYSSLPTWHSFAVWAGESSETISAENRVSIRVSPSWYTPHWSRLDAIGIGPDQSAAGVGGDSAPSRWTALRRTNHLVASVSR